MKYIVIPLFMAGCMFSLAAYGEKNRPRKRKYLVVAVLIWIGLLVLVNL